MVMFPSLALPRTWFHVEEARVAVVVVDEETAKATRVAESKVGTLVIIIPLAKFAGN